MLNSWDVIVFGNWMKMSHFNFLLLIPLRLDEVSRQLLAPVSIIEGESSGEARCWHSQLYCLAHHLSPTVLAVVDCVSEEVVKKEVVQAWVLVKCSFDVAEESAPDDTASPPHEGDASIVVVPSKLLGGLPQQHEALRVRHDLARVQSLTDRLDEGLLVSRVASLRWTLQDRTCLFSLRFQTGQAPCKHTFSNERYRHPILESRDGRPLPGSLLTRGVPDLLQQELPLVVLVLQDGRGDLDQEGVELALVPLVEDLAHLIVAHAKSVLHQMVGLANKLHVSILNAVVNHLNEVSASIPSDPVTAWLLSRFGTNSLEDWFDCRPGCWVASGHQRRTIPGTLLSSGHPGPNKENSLLAQS